MSDSAAVERPAHWRDPGSGIPAKGAGNGNARRDFEPGHFLSLRHGAFSQRKFEPLALELAAGLLSERRDLERFPEAVAAWADNEARAWLLREWLTEHGMFDPDKQAPREGPLKWLVQFDRRASDLRSRLGLDPRSEAELQRDRAEATRTAVDIEAVKARGRAEMERRAAEVIEAEVPEFPVETSESVELDEDSA